MRSSMIVGTSRFAQWISRLVVTKTHLRITCHVSSLPGLYTIFSYFLLQLTDAAISYDIDKSRGERITTLVL